MYPYISKNEKLERWRRQSEEPTRYHENRRLRQNHANDRSKRINSMIPRRTEEAVALNLQESLPPPPLIVEEREDVERGSMGSKLEPRKGHARGGDGDDGDENNGDHKSEKKLKKSDTEAAFSSLIIFFDKMMNKKQLMITLISFLCGAYAIYIGFFRDISIYGYESRHQSAQSMKNILFVYGLVQLTLSIVFLITFTATVTVRESHWGCQIIGGVIGCITYLLVGIFVLVVGVVGFYRVMALYGHVDYEDRQSVDYVDRVLYKSALFMFIFHICFILLKCCWWCR